MFPPTTSLGVKNTMVEFGRGLMLGDLEAKKCIVLVFFVGKLLWDTPPRGIRLQNRVLQPKLVRVGHIFGCDPTNQEGRKCMFKVEMAFLDALGGVLLSQSNSRSWHSNFAGTAKKNICQTVLSLLFFDFANLYNCNFWIFFLLFIYLYLFFLNT